MPKEGDTTIVKHHISFLEKINIFSKIKNKFPSDKKKLIPLILIILALPLIVGISLVQQELRSRASGSDRKIFLGIANQTNNGYSISQIDSDLEKIKSETGAYPAVYAVWANMDVNKENTLAIFRHLDSKGISPALYLMPVSNVDMERRDGRFKLVTSSELPGVGQGEIKFDNLDPAQITKIYVSKTSSGTENPNRYLVPTWLKGETIEVFSSKSNEAINYEGSESFKFEIVDDTANVGPATGYWVISVKPLKTTPLGNLFSPEKFVFISPSNVTAKKYTNANIIRGSLDSSFTSYAEVIRDYGKPVLLRYAQEMNGTWFHWSEGSRNAKVDAVSNDAGEIVVKGYGRLKYFPTDNTSDNFAKSWKHIYSHMKSIAPKTLFYWCGAGGKPIGGYFPGDEYVDYVGFDVYSGISNEPHRELASKIDANVPLIKSVSNKKIIIGELGIDTTPKSISDFPKYRKDWLKNGYEYVESNYPKIVGIMYFNVDMRDKGEAANNWLLWDSPEIASVYRALLLDPRFQGKFGEQAPAPVTPTNTPGPTITQPANPTTPPGSGSNLPYGFHDSATCTVITGWTCDEDDYRKSVNVDFYVDSPAGEGTLVGSTVASLPRESAVGSECGGVTNHGFSLTTPNSIKSGVSRHIYAYAVDSSGKKVRLNSSPKVVTCAGSAVPTPTPPDSVGCIRKLPTVTFLDTNKSAKRGATVTYRIVFKNNDVACGGRKLVFDLATPTTRWSYSPEVTTINNGETRTILFNVASGRYAAFGPKKLDLTIRGAYKPHTIFSAQTLTYTVVQ